jgi:RNA polymerase sigma factor (sigma-70 family)
MGISMPGNVLRDLIARLRQGGGEAAGLSDAQLLARFAAYRDEAAFELLVWRHGGLVLGAARRLLGEEADAEDAFQATFLTLARKAGSIRRGEALAAWLHQVVSRIARRERKRRARRRFLEQPLDGIDAGRDDTVIDDVGLLLDEEIGRLPERYRRVVVLCYLQGSGVSDAAAALGCPRGTVLSRLAAARELLKRRLVRRGVVPAVVAGVTSEAWSASPPASLVAAAVRLAGPSANVPNPILQMSDGVIHAMFWKKCRTLIALALFAGVCGVGIGADRGDQPGPAVAPAVNRHDDRVVVQRKDEPADAPPKERTAARERLRVELQRADKALDDAEAKFAAMRSDLRGRVIAVEEKLHELEYRQAWQREQQRRDLQNMETALRDWQAQHKSLEAKLRDRQIELDEAHANAMRMKELQSKGAADGLVAEKAILRHDGLRRAFENETVQMKQAQADAEATREKLSLTTKEALVGEEQRTAERVKLRRELAELEEQAQMHERALGRQRDRAAADVDALSAKLRQLDGAAEPPRGDNRDVQRQLEALQRELNELRRELKRGSKPD